MAKQTIDIDLNGIRIVTIDFGIMDIRDRLWFLQPTLTPK